MEELIKKYSEEFLDYANCEYNMRKEIEDLDKRLKILKQIIVKHENFIENPAEKIEDLNTQIYKINEEITNLGIEKNVNEIREQLGKSSKSEKKIKDYEIEIELDTLNTKKQKSANTIEEIKDSEFMLKAATEQSKKIENMKKEKLQELENKKNSLTKIIEEKINEKSETISNIYKIKEETIEKNQKDIDELEKVVDYISKQKHDSTNKQIIQKETLISVQKEIDEKRDSLNKHIKDSSRRITTLQNELSDLRNLKEDLDIGNAKDIIYKALNIQEEKEEKFDDFFDEQCKEENEIQQENEQSKKWKKDKNGNFYLDNEEEKSFIDKIKGKVKGVLNMALEKVKSLKNNFDNAVLNQLEQDEIIETESKENKFKEEIKVEITQEPTINNIEENVEKEEKIK